MHDKGLQLRGAWITGTLDLQGAVIERDMSLTACRVSEQIELVNARARGLYFSGCVLAGIAADNARLDGSLFLRSGTSVDGEIALAGAWVTGDLQLCDLVMRSPGQDAVFVPSLKVDGAVFLGNYPFANGETSMATDGAEFMASATVAHDFFITHCMISCKDDILGQAVFLGSEEHRAENALSLAPANIGGILFFGDNQLICGNVSLAGAHANRFKDEPEGPGAMYPIRLDGFTYEDFSRHTETEFASRLKRLERRPSDTLFNAQPYEQLARVLLHLGHGNDACMVLMRKELILRQENRALFRNPVRKMLAGSADTVLRFSVGYGYCPGRILVFAVVLVAGLGVYFQRTWEVGDMTPNSAPILVSPAWLTAASEHPESPGAYWASTGRRGRIGGHSRRLPKAFRVKLETGLTRNALCCG